ncbi:MAG: cyclic nucleotide-binding domain-containing protein [Candidatus Sumerlaeia bacterium]
MRHYLAFIILCIFSFLSLNLWAQEPTPEPSPTPAPAADDAGTTDAVNLTNAATYVMEWMRENATDFVKEPGRAGGIHWERIILILLVFILAGLMTRTVFAYLAKKHEEGSGLRLFFNRLKSSWPFFLIFSGINLVVHILGIASLVGSRFGDALDFFNLFLFFFCLISPLDIFVFNYYYPEKRSIRIPRLLQDVIRWVIYLVILAYTFSIAFKIPLMPLFATSAVLSFILGFALQDTLSNLFAGLAIHFEGSFGLGDWVYAGNKEGQVAAMTWRTIKIKTFEDDYMIIPNSTIAKNEIINYSQPTPMTGRVMQIGVSYEVPPGKVERVIMEILGKVDGVAQYPAPRIRLAEYSDFSINYNIRFWIKDYSLHKRICHDVFHLLWYHFKREDIEIPFPIRNVYMRESYDPKSESAIAGKVRKLGRIDFLNPLSRDERDGLAREMYETVFTAGETILEQDQRNTRFYIIDSGTVDVRIKASAGRPRKIASLGPGEFFGEHTLLTGEQTSATIIAADDVHLSVLDKGSFQDLLEAHPEIAESISHILVDRALEREKRTEKMISEIQESESEGEEKKQEIAQSLSQRIRHFFGLG